MEPLQRHIEHKKQGPVSWFLDGGGQVTVPTIPATRSIVASFVTFPIAVVLCAIDVILRPTLHLPSPHLTVPTIKEAGSNVAFLVANAVVEQVGAGPPARSGVTMLPGVHPQVTVAVIEGTGQSVAHLVAHFVASFGLAVKLLATPQVLVIKNIAIVPIGSLVDGDVHAARGGGIKDFTVLASVTFCAAAGIVARPINTLAAVLAGVVHALISVVSFTICPSGATQTLTPVASTGGQASAPVMTGHVLAHLSLVLTVGAAETLSAAAYVSVLGAGADTAVAARAFSAEILAHFTIFSHPAWLAIAPVVIDQLAAVGCANAIAGAGETFVDVSLTARTRESWQTFAFETANPVDTDTAVVTGAFVTFVHVDLAELAPSAGRTRAGEPVH